MTRLAQDQEGADGTSWTAAAAQADPQPPPSRREDRDRRQPRALHPRAHAGRWHARRSIPPAAWSPRWSRSCAPAPGVWIAHGSGYGGPRDGRRARPRLACRPASSRYAVRRVWLTRGGGAGLLLRLLQRGALAAVPHRARAARSSAATTGSTTSASTAEFARRRLRRGRDADDPIVLVQDYHFALLPQMIRERLPRATIITLLAHPVAERRERSASARGARSCSTGCSAAASSGSTRSLHCNNFLDTVDRFLEARIDREQYARRARTGRSTAGAAVSDLDRVAAAAGS